MKPESNSLTRKELLGEWRTEAEEQKNWLEERTRQIAEEREKNTEWTTEEEEDNYLSESLPDYRQTEQEEEEEGGKENEPISVDGSGEEILTAIGNSEKVNVTLLLLLLLVNYVFK
jgi:hypothetical protein